MLETLALVAKIYFGLGVVVGLFTVYGFFSKYETDNIEVFIESVREDREDKADEISEKVVEMRRMGVPDGFLNTLPYLGVTIHVFQTLFIWPWYLYRAFQEM